MTDLSELKNKLTEKKVVPVIGAGVSIATARLPNWAMLIERAIEYASVHNAKSSLLKVARLALTEELFVQAAEAVQSALIDASVFGEFLNTQFASPTIHSAELIEAIAGLKYPFIATTNYDRLLETIIGGGIPTETWRDQGSLRDLFNRRSILHLHGDYLKPNTVILGGGDYVRLGEQATYKEFMRGLWTGYTLLFIGCSLDGVQDPDLGNLLTWAHKVFETPSFPHYILLQRGKYTSEQAREIRKLGVEIVDIGSDINSLAGWIRDNLHDTPSPPLPASPPPSQPNASVDEIVTMVSPNGGGQVRPATQPPLRAYLGQLAETFRWLELQGIREAGTLRIELQKVYVALKAEPETEYDRQQALNLHSIEVSETAGVESIDMIDSKGLEEFDARNIRLTYRPGREEAKRAQVTDIRTLGDAFRRHRRVVILGGPGSGKTTLGRWLALQLAYAELRTLDLGSPQRVTVPLSQIDPDTGSSSGELVDLGPARLPIFLRLAHFARELAERERKQQPSLALIDYLGHDPDSCSLRDGLTPEARHTLFHLSLENQQSVVVLDGLDELSEANRRSVVLKIQDFMEKYIPLVGSGDVGEQPWVGGGNQVIVTSRYVGYRFAPVQAGCVHFGIQPMRRLAVERFAHSWTDAVNAELAAEGHPALVANRLVAEIYNETKPKVRELATNPLLITILATVYWRDGKLPDQRAGVYDRVVENLLRIWLNREECRAHSLTREELLAALEPLAADMQENSSGNGLISLARIGELVEGPLAHMSGMSPTDRRFRPRLEALLTTVRKHVGLLAEQSAGNYAFFHRTFQEFLAARHLLAERTTAAEKISDRIDDPIWREPLLLALGFVMIDPTWGPEAGSRLLAEVLAVDPPDALIPRAALLLVAALPDLRNTPAVVVEQIVVRLLTSYATILEKTQTRELSDQIEQMFQRLKQGLQADVVARNIAALIRSAASGRDLSGAAATILRRVDWFNTDLVEALLLAMHRDRAELDWPIHHALLATLGSDPEGQPWLTSAPVPTATRLVGTYLPLRKLLESIPDLVTLIRSDPDWLCLIVALYGGLGYPHFLEQMDQDQQQRIEAAKSAAARIPVLLEPRPNAPLLFPAVEFSPQNIVHDLADSDLGQLIQRHLGARKPARELVNAFRRRWEVGGSAEALISLAALGEDVLPLLRASLTHAELELGAHATLVRFSWLRSQLRGPLIATSEAALRTIPENASEQCQLDLLRIALTARIVSGGAPLLVSTQIPDCNYVAAITPGVRAAIEAEYWSYLFSGAVGDGRHEGAQFSAVFTQVTRPLEGLLHSWSVIHSTDNRFAARRLSWSLTILAPRADSSVERYLAMLEAMSGVPGEYHVVAGNVLARCWPILKENPALVWETLVVCWNQGDKFISGYRKFHRSRQEQVGELQHFEEYLGWLTQNDLTAEDNSRGPSWSALFRHISSITDPYLRFRAQWRFLEGMVGEDKTIEMDVLWLLEQIPDVSDQIRALEWILMAIPAADLGLANLMGLLDPLVRNLSQILDPENRARAQCRLAFFASEHLETLLHGAIESVRAIADPVRKAATITEIRAAWGSTAGMSEALDTVAQTISEPWERDKALGRASRLVQTFRNQYRTEALVWRLPSIATTTTRVFRHGHRGGALPWVILYLSTMATELEALAASRGGAALWERLLGDERHDAIAALVASGLAKGIPVTAREASILDRVLQTDQAKDLDNLWPYLDRPDPGAMGMVARWLIRGDRAGQWSALVQAESGRLNPEIVRSVIHLMDISTDRLRLRAMLALHGPTPYTGNKKRRWVVRRVGAETLGVLARYATQYSNSPALQTALIWIQHDIHHDDTKAIEGWLKQVESDGRTSPAAWILRSLESIKSTVTPLLLSALLSSSPDLQRTLLFGLARLAHCSEEFRDSSMGIHSAIASVPRELRATLSVLPKGAVALLQIAKEAVKAAQSGDGLQQARRLLESRRLWLDESTVSDDKECIERLKEIGKGLYIMPNSYWSETDREAAPLAKNPQVLQLLLSWLADANLNADSDGYTHHLLTATEALARFSPDTFAALAPPEFWEPILTEWAQYAEHWTARMAAIRLLGRLRRITVRVARALRVAMDDISFVQQAAYASVTEFRRIEGDILPELLQLIDDPSAAVVAATTRLLVSAARAEIPPADRRRILHSLQQRALRPSIARPVYLMNGSANLMNESDLNMTVCFVDNLDRILYRAIFDVSGL